MTQLVRQEIVLGAEIIVVKVGTRVLTKADGTLDDQRVASIAGQLARIRESGRRVALVSSGAVGAGLGRLAATSRPTDVARLQAAAAIGQSVLTESYNRALEPHQLHAGQVLLTAEGLQDRSRYLNVRNALLALFKCGAIPIINENDTVSVDELQMGFGDNDRLAALVTNLLRAPLLVLLTDVDGLYDLDPSDPAAKVLSVVTDIDAAQADMVHDRDQGDGARQSTGGMTSKLRAARIATSAGENVIIANGLQDNILDEILACNDVGTLFLAEGRAIDSRKRWIGWSAHPSGKLILDAGAYHAIATGGRSLLAVGVTALEGRFAKGDVVMLCNAAGHEFARGLINYSFGDMQTIVGQPTDRIAELLGHCPYDEVVHRDNLVVLG